MSLLDTLKKPFRKRAIKPLIADSTMGCVPGHGEKVSVRIGDEEITASLFHREGSRILYCRFRWAGKIVRKSTYSQTRAGALDGARCWIREIARTPLSAQNDSQCPPESWELSLLNK